MELQFANPWVLYLLWLVPAEAVWWYAMNRRRERALATFVSSAMQAKLLPSSSGTRFAWQTGLVAGGLLLMLVTAARPQWGTREEMVYQRSRDLVIALDVSRSMLANDVHPNRLQRAKADIMDLIRELPGDRVALLAFRRTGILLCPLTTDYAYVRQALDAVTPESAPRGETNIGDAIQKAMQAFESDEGAHKGIILISDGEDLSGTAIKAAEKAGEKKIPIFTVGLGDRRGSTIPEEDGRSGAVKYKGENVVSKLNNDVLGEIANKTGGAYLQVATASMADTTLGTLYREYLRQISGRDTEETLQRRHVERYQLFLLPAVLLLLAGASLSRGRIKTSTFAEASVDKGDRKQGTGVRARKPEVRDQRSEIRSATAALLAVVVAWATGAAAQTNGPVGNGATNATATRIEVPEGREGARVAQRLYLAGKYEDAAQAYLEAARTAGESSRRDFRFNAAASWFKAGKYQEAADILKDTTLTEQGNREDVFMGLGSALFRAADKPAAETDADKAAARERAVREAGESFKTAARVQPGNETAKRNLAVVLDALPEAQAQALNSALMAKYAQTPAGTIANEMLANQRKLAEEIPAAFSNAAPSQIKELEGLSARQKSNADLWIPLKGKLLSEIAQQPANTNLQQQIAFVNQMVENTRDQMGGSVAALRDLDPEAYSAAQRSEKAIYQFWRAVAPYPLVLQEDLFRQTNAITATPSLTQGDPAQRQSVKATQSEALALTRLFSERFAQSVPPEGTATNAAATGAGEQNQPKGITAEDRKKVLELSEQAAAVQQQAVQSLEQGDDAGALVRERESYRLLKEIEKLLPKDAGQSSSQSQEKQNEKKEQEKKEQPQENPPPQQPQQKPEESQPQQKPDEKQQEQKDTTPEDAKKLIEKALQREKDHEAEKRRMNTRYVPPSAIERDW